MILARAGTLTLTPDHWRVLADIAASDMYLAGDKTIGLIADLARAGLVTWGPGVDTALGTGTVIYLSVAGEIAVRSKY